MSITFTDQLDKPSEITAIPNQLLRPIFGASYGFDVPVSGGGGTPFANQYSVSFDGTDDRIILAPSSDFDTTSAFTISAWVNPTSLTNYEHVYSRFSSSHTQFYITPSGNLTLTVDRVSFPASTGTVSTGSWQHIAVSWQSGTGATAFYINGSAAGSGTNTGTLTTGTTKVTIGSKATQYGHNFFNGLMDEVALFNSALSASNITSIYNSGVPNDISSLSPVGWWRMGDNDGGTGTTITDQGSGSNNGTLTNGPTFSTSVPEYVFNRNSVSFDGSDDYLLMGTSAISLDTNFTISVWFKPTADALSGYDFMCGWGNAASGQSRVVQILNSNLSFEIYFSRVSGSTTLSADTWYHGAVTFSGNDVEIFLNGASDGTGTLSRNSMTSSLTFAGGTPATTAVGFSPFSGLIDEFAVFDSVLSNTEITAIYNSGVPADISSLSPVGWWRMGDNDGGTGTTITDQGSGGNNGTLTNGPTFSTTVPS